MSEDDDATNTSTTPNETASDLNINQKQLEAQINFAQANNSMQATPNDTGGGGGDGQPGGESETHMGCHGNKGDDDENGTGNCKQLGAQINGAPSSSQKKMEEDGLIEGNSGLPDTPMDGQQQEGDGDDDDSGGRESRVEEQETQASRLMGDEQGEEEKGDEVDECLHEQSTSHHDQLKERIGASSDEKQQYYNNNDHQQQHHHHHHHQQQHNKRATNRKQQVNHPYQHHQHQHSQLNNQQQQQQQHIVPVPPGDQSQSQVPISADYLAQLIKDKKQLGAFPAVFTHLQRLIDDEINKVRQSLFQLSDVVNQNEPLELPEPEGESVQLQEKIFVPVGEHPEYNFVGRLLGPRGMTAKQLEQETGCKIMIRGKGSMRDKKKEGQNRGKANWEHLNEELHVLITVEDTQNRAQVKLQRALEEVKQLLVPIVDGEDELKKRQLMELAIINGTYRDYNYNEALTKMLNDAVYRQQLGGEGAQQQPVAGLANGSPGASQRAFAASLAAVATTGHQPHHLNHHQNPYMGLQVAGPNAINGSPASSGVPDTGSSTPNSMHSSGHHHHLHHGGQGQPAGPGQHHQVKQPAAALSASPLPAAPPHHLAAGFPAASAIMAAAAAAAQQQQHHSRLAQHPSPMHTPTGTPGSQPAAAPPPNHLSPSGHHHHHHQHQQSQAASVAAAAAAAALMAGGSPAAVADPSALIYAQQYHEFHHHYAAMAAAAQQHHQQQQQSHMASGPPPQPQPPPEYPGPASHHPHPQSHPHPHPHPHQQSVAAAVAQAVAQAAAAAANLQHHHQLHHNPYQLSQAESEHHQAALAYQQHLHHHQQQHQMEPGKLEITENARKSAKSLVSHHHSPNHHNHVGKIATVSMNQTLQGKTTRQHPYKRPDDASQLDRTKMD